MEHLILLSVSKWQKTHRMPLVGLKGILSKISLNSQAPPDLIYSSDLINS